MAASDQARRTQRGEYALVLVPWAGCGWKGSQPRIRNDNGQAQACLLCF